MFRDFKQFLVRGDVVDVAVGVVMAGAFGAVIIAVVGGLLTPLIAAIFGEPDFSSLTFTVNGSVFRYGAVINAIVVFVLIAAAVFFLVVRPVNVLMARRKSEEPVDEDTRTCPECMSSIPKAARRCSFCTAEVGAVA